MENEEKPFHKGKKPFHKGRKDGLHKDRRNPGKGFKRRKLEPGVEFEDRKLGVGIVRKLTDDGIVVAFGDVEKVIPRKKREFSGKGTSDRAPRERGERREIFTFNVNPEKEGIKKEHQPKKKEPVVGLEVTDETLGKGIVSRITERGVYVTYESTGEHVLYPVGLPSKLLNSAFPKTKKENKADAPKGKRRTYTVPEQQERVQKKVAPHTAKETHRGNTHYIELGEGTLVFSPLYGEGTITVIADGHMTVEFQNDTKDFVYPNAFADGSISVIEKE